MNIGGYKFDDYGADDLIILGLGLSGESVARFCQRHDIAFSVMDSRENPPSKAQFEADFPEVPLYCGAWDSARLENAQMLIISPGIALATAQIQAAKAVGVAVMGDVEIFAHVNDKPVIAITGSNGKSTVTSMVVAMAKASGLKALAAGNIGLPVLDALEQRAELYVLELSSFQLETTSSLQCISATILNLSPDHMDRYEGMGDYAAAKARIFEHCQTAVINLDDNASANLSYAAMGDQPDAADHFVSFALDQAADYSLIHHQGREWISVEGHALMAASEVGVPGRHNVANALAAFALLAPLSLPLAGLLKALIKFRSLAHRTELVTCIADVQFINDSKATNIASTAAALAGLAGMKVLIAGGVGKDQDFDALKTALSRDVKQLILIGRDASLIADAVQGVCEISMADDMSAAVKQAWAIAEPGETVLLSPACASFDQFANYGARGDAFADAVYDIENEVRRG